MTRLKLNQSIGVAGWRRLAHLAFLLPAILDFLMHHEGTSGIIATSKELGSLLPMAYAISPDQNNKNNHLPQYQRNLHAMQSNDYNSCGSYCHNVGDDAYDKGFEVMREKQPRRRQAIEMFQSAKRSIGNKIIHSDLKIFDKNPFRKVVIEKKDKQNCLRETTRFVGGANLHVEAEENPQQHNSSLNSTSTISPDASQRKSKSFFVSEESKRTLRRNFQQALSFVQNTSSQAGPSIIAVLFLLLISAKREEISLVTLYTLALLGASCGFHLFLHFITLGYALGVTFPLIVALLFYQKQYELPLPTVFHSVITIVWGVRLFAFLAIREYVTWPALHQKVVEVQAKMKIPFASKILCWFLYSFFYVSLGASCWSRLLQSSSSSSISSWGILGYTGLSLQLVGLGLETIADLQKNSFKSSNRHSWCNVGVWKYSTHPNYLGEGMFWWGTYLAHGFHSPFLSILATVGLGFVLYVLKGSAKSLSSKQKEKYGQEVDFYQFQRTHNVFGPKQMWSRKQTVEAAVHLATEAMTNNYDKTVSISNDGNTQEINQ